MADTMPRFGHSVIAPRIGRRRYDAKRTERLRSGLKVRLQDRLAMHVMMLIAKTGEKTWGAGTANHKTYVGVLLVSTLGPIAESVEGEAFVGLPGTKDMWPRHRWPCAWFQA